MAETNRKLLAALREKLGSSPQALSQRRQRLQRKVAMPTDIATYVVAQRIGIRLDKYLDLETIEIVNRFIRDLDAVESRGAAADGPMRRGGAKRTRVTTRRAIELGSFKVPEGALSDRHVGDAEKMANSSYPVLYVFENAVREFLDGHLTAVYGKDWFDDSKIVSRGTRDTVARNRQAEAKARYHSQRNARPIYYTTLDQLTSIVRSEKGWKVFKDFFPRDTWFPELVGRFEVSRNVVAHMNPLRKKDIARLEDGLTEWLDQVADHQPP
jgi:Swt1-like HEPN